MISRSSPNQINFSQRRSLRNGGSHSFNCGVDYQRMSSERFSDLKGHLRMTIRCCLHFDWYISARVPARREKVGMHNDMPGARRDELSVTFRDCWVSDFKKRSDDKGELSSFADPQRRQPDVFVGFFAPAAMPHHQYRSHAGFAHHSLSSPSGRKWQKITTCKFCVNE